jgi:hypothetical protein
VLSIRRKSPNVAEGYWYALGIMLAIPLSLVIGGTDALRTAGVFALGILPLDALMKVAAHRLSSIRANGKGSGHA